MLKRNIVRKFENNIQSWNMNILILCTGNSCRSQMANGILQSFDSEIAVYSAGTEPADKVNPLAVRVMNEIGIDISSHYPKSVEEYIQQSWDYVITVCGGAKEASYHERYDHKLVIIYARCGYDLENLHHALADS